MNDIKICINSSVRLKEVQVNVNDYKAVVITIKCSDSYQLLPVEKPNVCNTDTPNHQLSAPAQKVLKWLQANRSNRWVKYSTCNRDQAFINFVRKHGYMNKDAIFNELLSELLSIQAINLIETEETFIIL